MELKKRVNTINDSKPLLINITLNVSRLNFPIKRHRMNKMAEWIKNKIQWHVACKRFSLSLKSEGDRKRYFKKTVTKNSRGNYIRQNQH